ncbi:hypothetical protein BJ878DRAFT_130199 [Calycina marina]|uniref:DUF7923 domain-containing protein n=1 Tax=Calycina marina TaxID=1763456 RepID=A0A9P8CDN0_9HELO|nr:hypothetical protein BJ878DRAFT_130199 [Calycina marina]
MASLPTNYRGRFKELQALELEARKDDLIKELLARLDELKGQRDESKSDLETEREARRRLQRTLRDSHPKRARFAVFVLHLDADVFLLDDVWLSDSPTGGEKIASALVEKVSSYLENILDDCHNIQIIVKIYGDLFKLWRKYESAGVELGNMDLTRFFSHFNRQDALIDFVDLGPRTQAIERKLSGVLSHFLLDDRTEHILFAAPHQNIPPILAPLDVTSDTAQPPNSPPFLSNHLLHPQSQFQLRNLNLHAALSQRKSTTKSAL